MPYKIVFAVAFKMLYPKASLKSIAKFFGGIHHSSILYYFHVFNDAHEPRIHEKKIHREVKQLFRLTKRAFNISNRRLILKIDGRYQLSKKEEHQADFILGLISKITNFSREEITSKKRTNPLVRSRMAFRLAFLHFCPNVPDRCIGMLLGDRDHTTSYWYKKLHNSCVSGRDRNNNFAREYRKLVYRLILKLSIDTPVYEFMAVQKIAA